MNGGCKAAVREIVGRYRLTTPINAQAIPVFRLL